MGRARSFWEWCWSGRRRLFLLRVFALADALADRRKPTTLGAASAASALDVAGSPGDAAACSRLAGAFPLLRRAFLASELAGAVGGQFAVTKTAFVRANGDRRTRHENYLLVIAAATTVAAPAAHKAMIGPGTDTLLSKPAYCSACKIGSGTMLLACSFRGTLTLRRF